NQQATSNRAYDFLLEPHQAYSAGTSVLPVEIAGDGVHLCLSLIQCCPGLQTSDRKQAISAATYFFWIKAGKAPYFRAAARQGEVSRHDADYGVSLLVQ